MDCHNEKLNRPRRPREKDNSMKPLYEKSLPSLPTEEKVRDAQVDAIVCSLQQRLPAIYICISMSEKTDINFLLFFRTRNTEK